MLSDDNGGEDCDKCLPCDCDLSDTDHSKDFTSYNDNNTVRVGAKQWGKDLWWRQDVSGELCSKDYVRVDWDSNLFFTLCRLG